MSEPKGEDFGQRRIFAVLGVLPEPGGYGIAKFSRSSLPYQEWIFELTQEGAQRFYESFYFDYGHASIADLAHLTIVLENISMVAAEELWDDPLIDGQASSTRYQDFERRGFHLPEELLGTELEDPYQKLCHRLIREYGAAHPQILKILMEKHAHERPPDMDDAKYERTLKARAFDVARYLLPMSIRTGLGQILSARTLERQLIRLFSHPLREMQAIAQELKEAVMKRPAFNPMVERLLPRLEELWQRLPQERKILEEVKKIVHVGAAAVPTLIKYTQPSEYLRQTSEALRQAAAPLAKDLDAPDGGRGVWLAEPHDPLTERVATLLYRVLPHSYAQILARVKQMNLREKQRIAEIPERQRARFDLPLRETYSGYSLIFDLCLDGGSWRDFHRHRRLVQIHKGFQAAYGFDTPKEILEAGLAERYSKLMEQAGELSTRIDALTPGVGEYALPFAYRRRSLFKMDTGELQYIIELRTRPENHFSVREIAYAMFAQLQRRYPELARHVRALPPTHQEFFKR